MQSIAASNLEAVVHVSILECREHSLPLGDRVCAVLALTWASVGQGELVHRHSVHTATLSGWLCKGWTLTSWGLCLTEYLSVVRHQQQQI